VTATAYARTRAVSTLGVSFVEVRICAGPIAFRAFAIAFALFANWIDQNRAHRASSSTSSFADFTGSSLSATMPTAVSIAVRVVISVQHHNDAFPSSG
jgi:hypothetical protein